MNRAKLLRYLASCIVLQITRQNRPAIRHQNSLKLDFLFDSGFARDSLPILYMIEIQQVRYYMKPIKQTNKTIWVKKFKTKKNSFLTLFWQRWFSKMKLIPGRKSERCKQRLCRRTHPIWWCPSITELWWIFIELKSDQCFTLSTLSHSVMLLRLELCDSGRWGLLLRSIWGFS